MRLIRVLLAALALAGCAGPRLSLSEHPLVDRVWDVAERRFLAPGELERRLAAADIALLGETHDNPAHHRIQTRILEDLVGRGRRPALAMEQFDTEWQREIDAAIAEGATATVLARSGRISGGWDWPLYKPLVALALKQRLPVVAANFSRARSRSVFTGGLTALGETEVARLALDQAWSAAQNAAMRRLLVDGHCGDDGPMIDKLIPIQRSRDAIMADAILSRGEGGAVAIIGRLHARRDIGVPLYLSAREPERRLLSLGLVEVLAERNDPAAYSEAAPGNHDLIWFTPRALRPDPCAKRPLAGAG